MRNPVQSTFGGIAIPYMAESDPQNPEFEDVESSDVDPPSPAFDGGNEDGSPPSPEEDSIASNNDADEASASASDEDFDEGVSDMLDSIEIETEPEATDLLDEDDSMPIIDSLLSNQSAPAQSTDDEPDSVEDEASDESGPTEDAPGEVKAIEDEIADAFSDDEAQGVASAPLPTPEELLVQAGNVLNGTETPLPGSEDESVPEEPAEEDESGISAMPDPMSLMNAAAEEGESTRKDPSSGAAAMPDEDSSSNLPTPDELLKQAAAGLNEEQAPHSAKPAEEAAVDDVGLSAMPDPMSSMNQAKESEEADERSPVERESVEETAAEDKGVASESDSNLPAPDDIIKHAASVLNEDDETPPVESDTSDSQPSPEEATDNDEPAPDEGEVMAMPDPQSLMESASDEPGKSPDLPEPQKKFGGNIADRAGNLPPPPPAPIALDDDEIYVEETPEPEEEEASADNSDNSTSETKTETETEGPNTVEVDAPVADDGDDASMLMDEEDLLDGDDALAGFNIEPEEPVAAEVAADASDSKVEGVARGKRPRSWLQTIAIAASFALFGLGLATVALKEEIYDFGRNGSIESSILSQKIRTVAELVFHELREARHYEVEKLESDIQWVSKTEAIVEVAMNAVLTKDLYRQVEDDDVYSQLEFDRNSIEQAKSFVSEHYPETGLVAPDQPWQELVVRSAREGQTFPVLARFRLKRSSEPEALGEWELHDLSVVGEDANTVWGKGDALDPDRKGARDVASTDFKYRLRSYRSEAEDYLEKVEGLKERYAVETLQRQKELDAWRDRLAASLSEGAYYKGMAIAGEDAADAREVSLLVTETRYEGGMIKGVMQLGTEESQSKHFTGVLDYVEKEDGKVQGLLRLTTIAFASQPNSQAPYFFKPGTVSRISLHADGMRMEGDGDEISLRLIRGL